MSGCTRYQGRNKGDERGQEGCLAEEPGLCSVRTREFQVLNLDLGHLVLLLAVCCSCVTLSKFPDDSALVSLSEKWDPEQHRALKI